MSVDVLVLYTFKHDMERQCISNIKSTFERTTYYPILGMLQKRDIEFF